MRLIELAQVRLSPAARPAASGVPGCEPQEGLPSVSRGEPGRAPTLANGRRLKCLRVADDFTHECVDITVDHGISGAYVVRVLDQAARIRGYPRAVRTDNGPEFTSRALIAWTQQHGIEHLLIEPGRPMQNGYIDSSTTSSGMSA